MTLSAEHASGLSELEDAGAEEILAWTYAAHRRVAVVASFQVESGVLIDLACRVTPHPDVLTIDTGRLPEETHEAMEMFRRRYPIALHVLTPDPNDVATMHAIAEETFALVRE